MSNRNSKFGSGGVYKCACCGRATRQTGVQSMGSELCPDCYEIAGIYNVLQDDGPEAVAEYAAAIREHCANIVAKGGELDSDAEELLEIVGAGA